MLIAAGTAVGTRAVGVVADRILGPEDKPASQTTVVLPEGSEGTIKHPDGSITHWKPGQDEAPPQP